MCRNEKVRRVGVTPFVGVWIEIMPNYKRNEPDSQSLPSWECGLKF